FVAWLTDSCLVYDISDKCAWLRPVEKHPPAVWRPRRNSCSSAGGQRRKRVTRYVEIPQIKLESHEQVVPVGGQLRSRAFGGLSKSSRNMTRPIHQQELARAAFGQIRKRARARHAERFRHVLGKRRRIAR